MTDAELLFDIFQGSDLSHGRTEVAATTNTKGKRDSKSWSEKRPAELKDFEGHLAGLHGIGIPPINSKNQVRWGAIDVDEYTLPLETLNKKIVESKLPLVLARSKSGGPHLFLFVADWVPAQLMIEKLDGIAAFLGFGTSEIFPKQASIGHDEKNPDYGSWINLPYFSGCKFFRYALDENNNAIQTIPAFHTHVRSRTLSVESLGSYVPPTPTTVLPDGPPCLNQILATRVPEYRNVTLANVAVYYKMASPDGWKDAVEAVNRTLSEPLPAHEVENLIKSYSKKDYRYQCSKQPLCRFCDSSKCKTLKYGIGGRDFLPAGRSLSMIRTEPPIWYLDLQMSDGSSHRISLSTDELQSPRLFQKRCMETIQRMPPMIKAEDWQELVAGMMEQVAVIEVPPEMGPTGQFLDLLYEFLSNRASADSMEDLIRGVPYRDAIGFAFRMKDLSKYMSEQKFTLLPQNRIIAVLKNKGAYRDFKVIAGVGTNFWVLPVKTDEPTPLSTTAEPKQDEPY